MDGGGKWGQNTIMGGPVFICGLSLVLARVIVVVEAFVSIEELPVGAYQTPTWIQVFPHFSATLGYILHMKRSIQEMQSLYRTLYGRERNPIRSVPDETQ